MLKKIFKLKGEEIKFFFKQPLKKINSPIFTIFYRKNNLDFPRFTVYCSQKIFKKAVLRNKIKRQIYVIIEKFLKKNNFNNYDVFLNVKKMENFKNLEISINELFNKIK